MEFFDKIDLVISELRKGRNIFKRRQNIVKKYLKIKLVRDLKNRFYFHV